MDFGDKGDKVRPLRDVGAETPWRERTRVWCGSTMLWVEVELEAHGNATGVSGPA